MMCPFPRLLREPPQVVDADAATLLKQLGARLQHADFLEIARCDYDSDVALHLEGLCRFISGDTSRPLRWHPGEVLELTRWSEPDAVALGAYAFEAAHGRRAFACAALLRSLGSEIDHPSEGEQVGANTTLIQLIASLRHLEESYDAAAAAFLQWLIPRVPDGEDDEIPFLGLGLLWFAIDPSAGVGDEDLAALADWVMTAEGAVAAWWRERLAPIETRPWLLSQTFFTGRHEVWRAFGDWLVERAVRRGTLVETTKLMAAAMRDA